MGANVYKIEQFPQYVENCNNEETGFLQEKAEARRHRPGVPMYIYIYMKWILKEES